MLLLKHSPPLRVGGSSQNLIPLSSPNKNAEIERAIRTIKEECLNITRLNNVEQTKLEVERFVRFYNHQREHSSLNGDMPINVWKQKLIKTEQPK